MGSYLRLTPALRAVLTALLEADGEVWGLQLVAATGRPTGTVYPLLARLEAERFLQSRWEDEPARSGPRRRLYMLTASGRTWAQERLQPAARDEPGIGGRAR